MNPGFFSPNYDAYTIRTNPAGTTVQRKQTDFADLRTDLFRLYPAYVVPPVPKRPLKKLEPDLLEKRRQKYQLFLDDVMKHPVLRASEVVWNFLTVTSESEYDKKKRETDKIQRPRGPEECTTLEGKAIISYDNTMDHACRDVGTAAGQIHDDLKRYLADDFMTG